MLSELKQYDLNDVLAWKPCKFYGIEKLLRLAAGRSSVTALDIAEMEIPLSDRLWAIARTDCFSVLPRFAWDCCARAWAWKEAAWGAAAGNYDDRAYAFAAANANAAEFEAYKAVTYAAEAADATDAEAAEIAARATADAATETADYAIRAALAALNYSRDASSDEYFWINQHLCDVIQEQANTATDTRRTT